MNNIFKLGDRIVLKSFHGTKKPPEKIQDSSNNYWILVGEKGIVVNNEQRIHPAFPDKGGRILVQFEFDIRERGLNCHNSPPNSLWIFASDLDRDND